MGLDINGVRLLLHAKSLGVDFSRVAMIGRQTLNLSPSALCRLLGEHGISASPADFSTADIDRSGYAEPLLKLLGAQEIESFDASPFEQATRIHDFNTPISSDLKSRHTCVIDGGTLEHVFNYPTAIRNCMEMVAVGGHFITLTPANNYFGHGFYQLSPELFYRVLSPANGYAVADMIMSEAASTRQWYRVADPDAVRSRVTLTNFRKTNLFVIARREAAVEIFSTPPQQSDYLARWNAPEAAPPRRSLASRLLPDFVRMKIWRVKKYYLAAFTAKRNRRFFRPLRGLFLLAVSSPVLDSLLDLVALECFI